MTQPTIHFGTFVWRGIIANNFTFSGARRATEAIAGHMLARTKAPRVIVGCDAQALLPGRLKAEFKEFAGRRAVLENRIDGLQLTFENGERLLPMRPSGVEPLMRFYAESDSLQKSETPAEEARAWVSR